MLLRKIALGTMLLIAPLAQAGAAPEIATTPAPATAAERGAKPADQAATPDGAAPEATAEDKLVCKSVRADPSSRRKTRVCRTMEEWRKLNIPI
jgi:hypothetical protein